MYDIRFFESRRNDDVSTCPVCKKVGSENVLTVKADGQYVKEDLVLNECKACQSMYFLGDDPVLGYDGNDFSDDYWFHYVQCGAGIDGMLHPLLTIEGGAKGTLLDIGCGFGFVPHYWQEMGHGTAVGLETSRYGQIGRELLGVDIVHKYYSDAVAIHDRKFDYVFSSEVIEHVQDPAAFVAEISQGLAADGILVLTTPSAGCLKPSLSPPKISAVLSPGLHYFIASREALSTLLSQSGFPHVRVVDLGERLYAWASHRPLPDVNLKSFDRGAYARYLEKLAENENPHVRGGALYRCFKDAVLLGNTELASKMFDPFSRLALSEYDIDFGDTRSITDKMEGWSQIDNGKFPAWLGTAHYIVALHLRRIGAKRGHIVDLLKVADKAMRREGEIAMQFAGEAMHFLPRAQSMYQKCLLEEVVHSVRNMSGGRIPFRVFSTMTAAYAKIATAVLSPRNLMLHGARAGEKLRMSFVKRFASKK